MVYTPLKALTQVVLRPRNDEHTTLWVHASSYQAYKWYTDNPVGASKWSLGLENGAKLSNKIVEKNLENLEMENNYSVYTLKGAGQNNVGVLKNM